MRTFDDFACLENIDDSTYRYQDLEDLNRFLLPHAHLHSYSEDQFLMVDNVETAHARFSTDQRPLLAGDGSTYVSQFYWDEAENLIACPL